MKKIDFFHHEDHPFDMDKLIADFSALHALIGKKVSWRDGVGVVVEILEDGPVLVVQAEDLLIQEDSYGNPRRRSRENRLIQVFNPEGTDYTRDFLEIASWNP